MSKVPQTKISKSDEKARVRTTLLEYGWQYGFSKEQRDKKQTEKKKAAVAAIPGRMKSESASEEDEYVVEQLETSKIIAEGNFCYGRKRGCTIIQYSWISIWTSIGGNLADCV
ncbi:coiled-coil domain-containing protein 93-like [Montipora foliosa]|uniref:coiled-coil domain-containing protein 93-like n=1 Tax=Montipora foliosa TaxID=591990 RepID=UPI0035F141BE